MVQLVAENPDATLIPGGYAKVLLTETFSPAKLAVKTNAVLFEGEKCYVYVVGAGDVAEKREVKAGVQIGDLQIVEGGLAAGERVVVAGVHKVAPGQAVVVK